MLFMCSPDILSSGTVGSLSIHCLPASLERSRAGWIREGGKAPCADQKEPKELWRMAMRAEQQKCAAR